MKNAFFYVYVFLNYNYPSGKMCMIINISFGNYQMNLKANLIEHNEKEVTLILKE